MLQCGLLRSNFALAIVSVLLSESCYPTCSSSTFRVVVVNPSDLRCRGADQRHLASPKPVGGSCSLLPAPPGKLERSEEHPSELQSLMRTSYAVFCLNKNTKPA